MRAVLPLLALAACDGPVVSRLSPSPSETGAATSSDTAVPPLLSDREASSGGFSLRVRGQELEVGRQGQHGFALRAAGWGRADHPAALAGSIEEARCEDLPGEVRASCARAWISASPALTSWWMLRGDGVQQGWTVPAPPEGTGELVFDVALPGASEVEVLEEGSAASFLDAEKRPWRVQGIRAWDARGEPLPATLEWTGESLRVSVDAEGATWPVNVDPLYTTVTSTWSGSTAFGRFGSSGAVLDANGDGFHELVVGAEGDDYSVAGRAFVYAGSATGIAAASSVTLTDSTSPYKLFGSAVLNAGDVNNDGKEDLIVGAGGWTVGASVVGRLYVYHGSSSGIRSTVTSTRDGSASYAIRMTGLRALGDLDGDGYDDVGVQMRDTNSFLIYEGTSSGLEASPAQLTVSACTLSDYDGAGDVNGDGYDDIVVGGSASSVSSGNDGCVMVLLGTTGNPVLDESFAGTRLSALGANVEPMGDLDADGYADVIVTAPSEISGSRYAGAIYGFYGSPSGMRQERLVAGVGLSAEAVGTLAYHVGDVDGDGVSDLLYSTNAYPSSGGTYWTVYHPESATHAATSTLWNYSASDAYMNGGGNVHAAGDVDGDGRDDVLVASDNVTVSSMSAAGKVVLYRGYRDDDGDGSATEDDCDDADATVYPGAMEVVNNGVDEDCDGGDSCYTDSDADGFGSATVRDSSDLDCFDAGEARTSSDCNDTRATVYPGAAEVVADGVDQDCDGGDTCSADADRDGYGAATATVPSADLDCADAGESTGTSDCDDSRADVRPGQPEVPVDGVDQDCDGGDTCYTDADLDGFGSATLRASTDLDCLDSGEASSVSDCDDARASTYPGAPEVTADGVDQDCDGGDSCYADADGDLYGNPSDAVPSADMDCGDSGESPSGTDCDDTRADIRPGQTELVADGVDQDCDGGDSCYTDGDLDGSGSATVRDSTDLDCLDSGEARSVSDCDDARASIYPGAPEVTADGVDQDCDGGDSCYADADGDLYGNPSATVPSADMDCGDSGESPSGMDCDDTRSDIRPGQTELVADGVDQDCDGGDSCYADADLDGFGSATVRDSTDLDCLDAGEARSVADCDDARASIYPGAPEVTADGVDQDCDGGDSCYADADGDLYGNPSATVPSADVDCGDSGESPSGTDCDDTRSDIRPGQPEVPVDGVDQDCDGGDSCYADADLDGFGAPRTVASVDLDCTDTGESVLSSDCEDADDGVFPGAAPRDGDGCMQDADLDGFGDAFPSAAVTPGTDCDDASAATFPGAAESEENPEACRADVDGDGFGDSAARAPVQRGSDCDDASSEVSPATTEVPGDGLDGDCDGSESCFVDSDRDGYGTDATRASLSLTCANAGESALAGDCDDDVASVHPSAVERTADGVDQDCDGGDLCHADADADGYASADGETVASPDLDCSAAGEASADAPRSDCDEQRADIHPGAAEVPLDGLDQDCDGGDACRADRDGDGLADATGATAASDDLDCLDAGEASADAAVDCDDSNPGVGMRRWYRDADGDGFGSDTYLDACTAEAGWSLVGGDCDDADAEASTAPEACLGAAMGCSSQGSAPASVMTIAAAGLAMLARRRRRS